MKYAVRSLLLSVLFVAALGCDKATPTAPSGSILTISANPAVITSATGTSTISVTGRRSNGGPLADGTEIRLSTNLGTIQPIVTLDRNGEATATLRGDGRVGKATVTASAGTTSGGSGGSGGSAGSAGGGGSTSGILSASIDVEIGSSATTINLQPTPTTLPANGGRVTLLAIVRDSRGQPMAGQGVNFTTDLGQLASRGTLVLTNAQGEARDTLTVRESDLTNNPSSLTVGVQTTKSDGSLVQDDFQVQISGNRPVAAFDYSQGRTQLEVDFRDRSTGPGTLSYSWDFGDNTGSNLPSPDHTYAAPGDYTVRLTVTDPSTDLSDTATARITVPVTTPGSGS